MNSQKRYENAVQQLAHHGYEVSPEGQGYIVRHLIDTNDVSHMRNLDDLLEFVELLEWAKQRQARSNLNKQSQELEGIRNH